MKITPNLKEKTGNKNVRPFHSLFILPFTVITFMTESEVSKRGVDSILSLHVPFNTDYFSPSLVKHDSSFAIFAV